jgi:GDP/GTP exchange factor required for growth at low temperature
MVLKSFQKSYQLNNFHAVVAIMTALQTRWVLQAIGKMGSKLGIWESRLFADLQYFTSPNNDFQLVRQSVASLSPGATGKEIADDAQHTGEFSGCVAFIGMYLSQLFKHNQLPQYIDPSSPNDPVNPEATLEDLCRPEVFADLKAIPPFMTVRPLLNVHKERLLATVIKSLVAGQHLASMVNHQVDQKLYWKCMRLKCLDPKALEQLSSRRDA